MATPVKFKITVDTPAWLRMIRDRQQPVATAAVAALRQVAADSVQEGRENIASSGGFGANWQRDLQYSVSDDRAGGQALLSAKAVIFHKSALAGVFEQGITISGKPLLWIPTTPGAPAAGRSRKRLVSATVNGTPMLFDAADRDRHRKPL
jgi:hypothetical protein